MGGTFYSSPDFDFGSGTFNLTTDTGPDEAFFAKYVYNAYSEPSQPTNISFSSITTSSMILGFTGSGADGYLFLRKVGSYPTGVPVDATGYSAGNTIGDGTVAYVGSATSVNLTGLTEATDYYYKIFAYNGTATSYRNYNTGSPLSGHQTTYDLEPTVQSSNIAFTSFTTSPGHNGTADEIIVTQR